MAEKKSSDWKLLALLIGGAVIGGLLVYFFARPLSQQATYINEESWEIVRDARGKTIGVQAHRHAKEGN